MSALDSPYALAAQPPLSLFLQAADEHNAARQGRSGA